MYSVITCVSSVSVGQFSSVLNRLNKSRSIIALQDASISLVPMILTVTFLMMLSEGLAYFGLHESASVINAIYQYFYVFFPLIFTVSLAVSFAKSKEVDPTALVIICISMLTLSVAGNINNLEELRYSTYFKIIPIPLCYLTATLLRFLATQHSLHLFKADFMSYHLNKTFNYIIPSAITFVVIFVLFMLFESIWQTLSQSDHITQLTVEDTSEVLGVIIIKLIYKLTWFFGVNPSHIFSFLQMPYHEAFNENAAAFAAGAAIPHINVAGNFFFTDIGGTGSAMCLILALLLYSKSTRNRRVAKLAALPATFNISEIVHYGLPVVFNPYLLVPFLLTPIVLYLNTYLFLSLGLVSPVVVAVPWTTPPLLNVYLATGGDLFAVVLQLMNIAIGVLIYLKFIRMLESSHLDEGLVKDFMSRFSLESKHVQALHYRNQQSMISNLETERRVNAFLLKLSHGRLLLNYQPIIDTRTGQVAKLEALLRLQDKHGNVSLPTFIDDLAEVGLSTEIDKWVVKRAVKQSHDWPDNFSDIRISINISPTSLLDQAFIDFLIDMHDKARHPFCIEILENQAVFEEHLINQHLKRLKDHGITILLDDFGSGYSALALLSRLNIHGVKYDMEFTHQLQTREGTEVFESCLNISRALNHHTILEGIETEEQYQLALKSGVDYIQGFYIAQPLTHEGVVGFVGERG